MIAIKKLVPEWFESLDILTERRHDCFGKEIYDMRWYKQKLFNMSSNHEIRHLAPQEELKS